jgi:hypothetical protein
MVAETPVGFGGAVASTVNGHFADHTELSIWSFERAWR